ncbi:hypothetical protein SAMN05421819_0856 [Bryocella elongata]|uniref:Uncharacterized protein n=1 Tax=Bryocella elongata TaxID=863522 RepID=A0A1H5U5U9_9BACT|nr:hypothetical protein [Bryocella elongata]SEF69677.1 hypothetical protein SAMN05421819_0856 [Bryocella elongata]
MIPSLQDPRWKRAFSNVPAIQKCSLSTRMLFARIKVRLQLDTSDATLQRAISEVHDYFEKNYGAVKNELPLIFG